MVSQTDARNPEILGHARELDAPVALKVHDIAVGVLEEQRLGLDRGRAGHAEDHALAQLKPGRGDRGLPRRQLRGGLGGQHHHAFLRLFLFLLRFGNLRLRLFGGLFRHGLLSLLFLLRGLFLGYGLLRLFRKRIGRRNFTHRGRCGLFRRDSGIGCGSRRFGLILTRRSFLIGRDRGHIKRGRTAAQRPVVERNQNSALIPFRIAQGRQLGKSGHILRKGARHHLAFARGFILNTEFQRREHGERKHKNPNDKQGSCTIHASNAPY